VLYYVSVADNHTGEFVGGMFVNVEDEGSLEGVVLTLLQQDRCVELLYAPVPANGDIPIPSIGKLLTRKDLERAGLIPRSVRVRSQ
jgi:hypothetical protein